jgi:hypothetical protein
VTVSAASSNETMSDQTAVVSPQTPEANMLPDDKVRRAHIALGEAIMAEQLQHQSQYTHPIDTAVPSGSPDRTTPRAQTRQDFEEERKRRSARVSVSLAGMCLRIVKILCPNFSRYCRIR